jgi:MoxR-like ATPase
VDALLRALGEAGYVADRALGMAVFLALAMGRPLFLEGEAGVGKTEVGKVLARLLDAPLIRLQCYEGLDVNHAVYEWDYPAQMLQIRLLEASHAAGATELPQIMSRQFLIARPLLQALETTPSVLLIDEIDRADEEFEAYLLEILSDFQVTIPEIGTIRAHQRPIVIVTSNRTREIHDALKRRCLYAWIDYPTPEREYAIVASRVPQASGRLGRQLAAMMAQLRREDLFKAPGVAETLDWAQALLALGRHEIDLAAAEDTLGAVLKYQEDLDRMRGARLFELVQRAVAV